MFYSATPSLINDNSSYLHSKHVFSGQYWDEFGITGYLVPDSASVLMLGLSLGGGVRPLLAARKNIDLTCVDIDASAVSRCQNFYRQHFPQLKFDCIVSDASDYLLSHDKSFDCIWLDIYLPDAYSPLVFDSYIYVLIELSLKRGGVLLVNSYGLPNQFSPLARTGIQSELADVLRAHFPFVAAIPYRRNITFVASREKPTIYPCEARPELSKIDQTAFESLALKTKDLKPLSYTKSAPRPVEARDFVTLDARMRSLWTSVLHEMSRMGVQLERPLDLLEFIQNQEKAEAILERALKESSPLLLMSVPILCAGESHLRPLDVDWIFSWAIQHAEELGTKFPEMYRQIWLPQIWSMVLQPASRSRHHYFQIAGLIRHELT